MLELDPRIRLILEHLHKKGYVLKGIKRGIRVKFPFGIDVDIYNLSREPEQIRARIRCGNTKADLDAGVKRAHTELKKGLAGLAEIDGFSRVGAGGQVFGYYSRIEMKSRDSEPELVLDISPVEEKQGAPAASEMPNQVNREDRIEAVDPETGEPLVLEIFDESGKDTQGGGAEKSESRNGDESTSPHLADPMEQAVEMLESVDPGAFRKAMDGLGLPRSSIIRVALMRMYRAAVDVDELRRTTQEEAARINSPQDRSILQRALKVNKNPVLAPLIQGLWDAASGEITVIL